MKKMKWLALALVLVLGLGVFAACGDDEPIATTTFKVQYYDGTTVLKTEMVESGKAAPNWTPAAKEGKEFVNWYVDEGLNRLFDFKGEKVTADKNLYAGYAEVGTADTRTWAIAGLGKSDILSSSSWGTVFADIHQMTKTADKNEFTFTIDLYKGDQFQFATGVGWLNQRGAGYIAAFDRAVDIDGVSTTVFSGGGGIGETADKQKNITVEKEGNYTFTLKTYIDEDYFDDAVNNGIVSINNFDSITWKYNGVAATLAESYLEFYIKGQDITGWGDIYNDATRMTRIGKDYEKTLYLKAGDQVMFTSKSIDRETEVETVGTEYIKATELDEESKVLFTSPYTNNLVPAASGNYTFKYNLDTDKLNVTFEEATMEEFDYYLDGKIGDSNWEDYPKTGEVYDYAFTKKADGTYLIENVVFNEGDQFVLRAFETDVAPAKGVANTSYNYRYFKGTNEILDAADADKANYNIMVMTAGTYSIKYDPYSKVIALNIDSVYIKGSFAEGWKITDADGKLMSEYKLAESTKGIFEITMTITDEMVDGEKKWEGMLMLNTTNGNDGTVLGVDKLTANSDGNVNALFRPEERNNLTCTTAGTYKFVYDRAADTITITAVTVQE